MQLRITDLETRLRESHSEANALKEEVALAQSSREEEELKRVCDYDAYGLIGRYLASNYGLEELRKFAGFWAATVAAARGGLLEKSKEQFLAQEARIEKAWLGREVEILNTKKYVGLVESCPLKLTLNQQRADLPIDYFCDNCCSVAYTQRYALLGLESRMEKIKDGCRLEITIS